MIYTAHNPPTTVTVRSKHENAKYDGPAPISGQATLNETNQTLFRRIIRLNKRKSTKHSASSMTLVAFRVCSYNTKRE